MFNYGEKLLWFKLLPAFKFMLTDLILLTRDSDFLVIEDNLDNFELMLAYTGLYPLASLFLMADKDLERSSFSLPAEAVDGTSRRVL